MRAAVPQPPAAELRPHLPEAPRLWESMVHFASSLNPDSCKGPRARTGKEGVIG